MLNPCCYYKVDAVMIPMNIKNFSHDLVFIFCKTVTVLYAEVADTAWNITYDFDY